MLNTKQLQVEDKKKIKRGLVVLNQVFNRQQINYRVLGSVLVAAINQGPHRQLGDIDVLLDINQFQKVKTMAESFTVRIWGIKLPYLYLIFSFLYNLYGGLRVRFGKKYEIWE